MERWRGPDGEALAAEVFRRLVAGQRLDALGLGEVDGRVDLRGLPAPPAERLREFDFAGWRVAELGGMLRFESVVFESLDLTGAQLEHLRIFDSRIGDCRFDRGKLQDLRMWSVDVRDSSFEGADLRGSALGTWYNGRSNDFRRVAFRDARLQSIACSTASFVDCDFAGAKLSKVDFGSSSFVRCRFAGPLRQVVFARRGFRSERPDPNPMEDVDFSGAEFSEVEFHELNLDRVTLPTAPGHLVLHHYRCVLDCALRRLADDPHPDAPAFRAFLEVCARWVGPQQEVGVFAVRDLDGLVDGRYAVELLRRCEQECS